MGDASSSRQRLTRQPFQNLYPTFQCTKLAASELPEPGFQSAISDWWSAEVLTSIVRQPKRKASAVVRIRLALNQAGADQCVDRATNRGRTPAHVGGDLIKRRRF